MGMDNGFVVLCDLTILFQTNYFSTGNKYPKSLLFVCVSCVLFHRCVFASRSHMNTNTSVEGQ